MAILAEPPVTLASQAGTPQMGGVTAHAAALRASIEEDTAAMWEVLESISQHFDIALAPYARRRRRQ